MYRFAKCSNNVNYCNRQNIKANFTPDLGYRVALKDVHIMVKTETQGCVSSRQSQSWPGQIEISVPKAFSWV